MIDSLYVSDGEIRLTHATLDQLEELLGKYVSMPLLQGRNRMAIRAMIEDLINDELPLLIVENVEAIKALAQKVQEATVKKRQ